MKQTISIFGNSTSYYSMSPGMSYVDLLRGNGGYEVRSSCMNGNTIWHANHMLPNILDRRGGDKWVILHVGASEAATMKIANFLLLASYWLNFGVVDHYFMTFIAPKIYQASIDLQTGVDTYHSLLTNVEFKTIYDKVLKSLELFSVLALGMSRPNSGSDIRIEQARDFDSSIKDSCIKYPWARFIDVWGLCEDEIIDSNHLTDSGHDILYREIMKRIQS